MARVTDPKITHYDLFGGLSLTCTEAAEPESHIHPDSVHTELWRRLTPRHTALWNGLRGGLIAPAADFDVQGLSREAFSTQWSRRGADVGRMEQGDYYAYELCGFFAFDSQPDNKEVIRELRRKVEFLVEDAPALALSVNPKAPVRVTDLGRGYRNSAQGSGAELVPPAAAGQNPTHADPRTEDRIRQRQRLPAALGTAHRRAARRRTYAGSRSQPRQIRRSRRTDGHQPDRERLGELGRQR